MVQARARSNPTIGVEVEDVGVKDSTGLSRSQTTLSASQALELGGKRQARIAASGAEVSAAQARQTKASADFAYDLAIAYATAEAAQKRTQLLESDVERAAEDLRVARALVSAGKEADLRAVQAQVAVTAADADLQASRADFGEALANLSVLAGASETYTSIEASVLDRADGLSAPVSNALGVSPAVAVAEAERQAAAFRVDVERARAIPDVTLSIGARRYDHEDDTGLVVGASVPLPLFDRNRGSVSAASAQLTAANARLASARLEEETGRRIAASQLTAGDARLKAAIQAEQAAGEAYNLARIGYEGGKSPLIELLNARRAVTEAQSRLLDARLARIRAEAALARLSGRVAFGE
jgi:cobalt-zinc-cadmium efflux system outer membrane protein